MVEEKSAVFILLGLVAMNVCAKYDGNPWHSYWDISI